MNSFTTFSFPTTTLFGVGALSQITERLARLKAHRPLVVTDAGLLPTEAFQRLQALLGAQGQGQSWVLFSGVNPNPIERDVKQGAEAFRVGECDAIVAFGGGSALDVGKAIRLLIKRPKMDLSEFRFEDDWTGLAPFVAIPTTAGTGSEVGRSSVIILDSTKRKGVLFHPELLADLVILDPEVTRGLPPKLTAATGVDALTHCIESFTSPEFHPLCDGIALEGIHLIVNALPRAFRDGADLDARGKMLVAAAMGAIAFQKDLGATHSLAHPLSSVCGMHHGMANAECLPAVMRFNARHRPGLYRRVGLACGLDVVRVKEEQADLMTINFVSDFIRMLGLSQGLHAYGVKEGQLKLLAEQAIQDACHKTNPVPVTVGDMEGLYRVSL